MKHYLYLSLIPESLIASMLPPKEFGSYMATGTHHRNRGLAMFFEISQHFKTDYFKLDDIDNKCVKHSDGRPRKSTYLSIYRVLENVPLSAFGKLYLTTGDGKVLALSPKKYSTEDPAKLHLYQELCPVNPRIVSTYAPQKFCTHITNPAHSIQVSKIVFAELVLDQLAHAPEKADGSFLPYKDVGHLQECLTTLSHDVKKHTKTVVRTMPAEPLYRTIKNGVFLGNQDQLIYYPMPSKNALLTEYCDWWRSALSACG